MTIQRNPESSFGFIELKDLDATFIAKTIYECSVRDDLNPEKMRCSTMSGKDVGV